MSQSQLKAESVSKNPFFQVLRQTYNELYSLAAKRGWKICVPHTTSISGATLNEHFFKSHILQSSPYFVEEYVTLNGQCVIYKDGMISTKTGFDSARKVYVLGEELFYTPDFKSFTVYSISSPLIGFYNDRIQRNDIIIDNDVNHVNNINIMENISQISIQNRNINHWKQILSIYLDEYIYKQMMNNMQLFSDQFNRCYVLVKGYTASASKRVLEYRDKTLDELLIHPSYTKKHKKKKHKQHRKYTANELDELKSSFDCYLNMILFNRIFNTFLIRHFKSEDTLFSNKLCNLQSLSQKSIGIKPQFESITNFKYAVKQLSLINDHKSPINKLGVLADTLKLIRQCIEEQHREQHHKEQMALTTEDMLLLFTFVLIHCNPPHILSNNEYIKHFYFPLHCTAHLDYFAATLEATIQYIKELKKSKTK